MDLFISWNNQPDSKGVDALSVPWPKIPSLRISLAPSDTTCYDKNPKGCNNNCVSNSNLAISDMVPKFNAHVMQGSSDNPSLFKPSYGNKQLSTPSYHRGKAKISLLDSLRREDAKLWIIIAGY